MEINLKKKILEKIKPNKIEHDLFEKVVNKFVRKLRKSAKKNNLKCDFFIGGSFGKGTYLKNTFDVDIFSRFDLSYEDSKLSKYLEAILNDAKLKFNIQKGSRDYYSVKFGPRNMKIIFEVIPNRKIKNTKDALNTTDLSPFHVNFLKKKIEENPSIADEIRITKQFFKAKKLYGAESYINAFSGHSIDILIAKYQSFENLIENAKSWSEKKYIDINSIYKDDIELENTLGKDKLSSLTIIDPIISDRNASRALCEEKYFEFLYYANTIENFQEKDFEIEQFNEKETISTAKEISKENNLNLLLYKFKIKLENESEDIAGAKMLKLKERTQKYFESFNFKIFDDEFFIDFEKGTCLFVFFIEKTTLPTIKKITGPKTYMKQAISNFIKKRDNFFVENGKVCTYQTRGVQNINQISNITLEEFEKMSNNKISFVKSLKLIKN